jgi:hypothetical protein
MPGDDDDNAHYLDAYLQERLPALGLDYETYGSYVTGLTEDDEADWDEIMELLQASSESHGDDDASWISLKEELQKRQARHEEELAEKMDKQKQERLEEDQERLLQDIALSQQAKEELLHVKPKEIDDAKKALLARFAYDESETYDNDGKMVASGGTSDNVITNKDMAAQVNQEKSKELKQQSGSSKKDEQAKTKQAREDKVRGKEERRKKTTKGERKA